MTVRERMLAIKLIEKAKNYPEFIAEIGLKTDMKKNQERKSKGRNGELR